MFKRLPLYLLLFVVVITLTGCSSSDSTDYDNSFESDNDSGSQYIEDDEPLNFHGYKCTEDCSGHDAGYQWAEDKGIDDPDDCGGNSQSFVEGCQSYAEENQ